MPAKTLLSSLAAAFGARTSLKIFQKLERLLRAPTAAPEDFFLDIISYFKPDDKKQIYSTQLASLTSGSRWNELNSKYFDNAKNLHWLDQLLSAGINSHLPDDLLVKVDIASMAHALEIRSPMLDHEFMELCAQMPANMKMRGGNKKYLLKQIALDHLPSECVNRPKKGFSVPLEYWFRGEFENYLRDNLLDKKFIDSGFNRSGIEQMLNDLKSKKHDYSNQLYALLCLRLWYKVWFE